jgi:hypothetical protein
MSGQGVGRSEPAVAAAPDDGAEPPRFNPQHDDHTRTEFVVQAEALGYPTAWLGFSEHAVACAPDRPSGQYACATRDGLL